MNPNFAQPHGYPRNQPVVYGGQPKGQIKVHQYYLPNQIQTSFQIDSARHVYRIPRRNPVDENGNSSSERLKRIVQDAQKQRSTKKVNWKALQND